MREIGGYIELDTYRLPMLHDGAIALNCGRNALAYLLRARSIRRLWIPKFICNSVTGVCDRENVPYALYSIGTDLLPSEEIELGDGEWFYFVNYYSQFSNEKISEYVEKYQRVIVDQVQSYFQPPIPGVDTIYTCRKYFGVADGAFLYTDASSDEEYPADESFERIRFLVGRYERTASEFYGEYAANNDRFVTEPVKRMSKLTRNMLHAIDYDRVKTTRQENYAVLHDVFAGINELELGGEKGTFMYPLMLNNGKELRKRLQAEKIYIPTLWPDVFSWCSETEPEYAMAERILPLPIDQRYDTGDMAYIVEEIQKCMRT